MNSSGAPPLVRGVKKSNEKVDLRVYSAKANVTVDFSIEAIEVEQDLFVCRETMSKVIANQHGDVVVSGIESNKVSEFAVDRKNLDAKLNGLGFKKLDLWAVSDKYIEDIRTKGFDFVWREARENKVEWCSRDFFADFAEGKLRGRNLIRIDFGNYLIAEKSGLPLPAAIHFDYMAGGIHDGRFDLEKAASHLLSRDDVVVFQPSSVSHGVRSMARPVRRKIVNARDCICDVPHYNWASNRSRYLSFKWMPSIDQYRAVAAMAENLALSDQVHKAIFDSDALGLRAAGAARFSDYNAIIDADISDVSLGGADDGFDP
jgi:hypothetical protein